MTDKTFLDVDETILANKLLLPGSKEDQEIDEIMKQFESKPFTIVQPLPGSCIKTKTDTGEKIFVNICITSKIPAPDDISEVRLLELLNEETPPFSIPMSIGNERLESDKSGAPCLTYDVAINDKYFEKCQNSKTFWLFTISVTLDGISNKFNKTINTDDYVVLKNRKVVGKLQQHRIENREPRKPPQVKKPLIEEISGTSLSKNPTKKETDSDCNQTPGDVSSQYVILNEPADGPTKRLIGLFKMPKAIDCKDSTVLVNSERIVITVEKERFKYDVTVPYVIEVNNVEALLDRNMRILRLNMPVVKC